MQYFIIVLLFLCLLPLTIIFIRLDQKNDIKDQFTKTILYGYETRKNNQDGLKLWIKYKENSLNSKNYRYRISNKIKDLIKKVNYHFTDDQEIQLESLCTINNIEINNIKFDNTYGSRFKIKGEINNIQNNNEKKININKPNHFLIQLFRIPKMSDDSLSHLKLMQIAYNIGQLKFEFEQNTFDKTIENFFKENSMEEINTYVY